MSAVPTSVGIAGRHDETVVANFVRQIAPKLFGKFDLLFDLLHEFVHDDGRGRAVIGHRLVVKVERFELQFLVTSSPPPTTAQHRPTATTENPLGHILTVFLEVHYCLGDLEIDRPDDHLDVERPEESLGNLLNSLCNETQNLVFIQCTTELNQVSVMNRGETFNPLDFYPRDWLLKRDCHSRLKGEFHLPTKWFHSASRATWCAKQPFITFIHMSLQASTWPGRPLHEGQAVILVNAAAHSADGFSCNFNISFHLFFLFISVSPVFNPTQIFVPEWIFMTTWDLPIWTTWTTELCTSTGR